MVTRSFAAFFDNIRKVPTVMPRSELDVYVGDPGDFPPVVVGRFAPAPRRAYRFWWDLQRLTNRRRAVAEARSRPISRRGVRPAVNLLATSRGQGRGDRFSASRSPDCIVAKPGEIIKIRIT